MYVGRKAATCNSVFLCPLLFQICYTSLLIAELLTVQCWTNHGVLTLSVSGSFALGSFTLKVGPFATIIKKYFNELNAYFNLK